MIAKLRRRIAEAVQQAVRRTTGERIDLPTVEDPPRPDLGDLAVPVALELAGRLDRSPREVAEELRDALSEVEVPGVRRWEVAGPGFLNVDLDRGRLLWDLVEEVDRREGAGDDEEGALDYLVEHTSINPNKAAHVGHLRNAVLGDTLVRALRHRGHRVEVHNYIDDTGVQVADVVVGLIDLEGLGYEEVRQIEDPFDYYCWDLYTKVTAAMRERPELRRRRRQVLLALEEATGGEASHPDGTAAEPAGEVEEEEQGAASAEADGVADALASTYDSEEARVARVVVDRIVGRHLRTMRRLGIRYDLLAKEGDIVGLDLWSEAFELLKGTDDVYYADEGKHEGCWMMRLRGADGFEALEEADKVLVRSNGTATYVAKDIAYHLWKFGLLERKLRYRRLRQDEDHVTWESVREGGEEREFGGADRAVTVIDVRQSYLQAIVAHALQLVKADVDADDLTHFAYEMVALSPGTADALGIPVDEDARDRRFVEMSGRRGYGVKADDLLDLLEERAAGEVAERNPDLEPEEWRRLGGQIAVGAARYFLLKFNRNTVIAFDIDEALSFEGETGPYVQYAAVRAGSIFDKAEERWGLPAPQMVASLVGDADREGLPTLGPEELGDAMAEARAEGFWELILTLCRFDEAVEQAVESLELSGLAKYAFELARQFNRFYHRYPILQEEDPVERGLRLLVAHAFRRRLETTLGLLGIPLPEKM